MTRYDEQQTMTSNGFFDTLDLQDTFRLVHGDKIDFSFRKQSRIDRMYVNEALHGSVKSFSHISVLGRELDHKMIEIEIAESIEIGKGYWKFNTSLLRDKEYTEMIKNTIREEKEELHSGVWDSVADWWEYLKYLLRVLTIDYCKQKEKRRRQYLAVLKREMENLESDIFFNIDSENARAQVQDIYTILEKEEARRAEGCRVRARIPNFETSEPSIAYLSGMEKSKGGRNLIYALKDPQGHVKSGSENVIKIAHEFYTDLFTSQHMDEEVQHTILEKLDQTVPSVLKRKCDEQITKDELSNSLRSMQNNKSPGSDGFPAEFWKFFWSEVSDEFLMVVDWVYDTGRLTKSMSEAIIRLLYKKGDRMDIRLTAK